MTLAPAPAPTRDTAAGFARAAFAVWFLLATAAISVILLTDFQWQLLVPFWVLAVGLPLWFARDRAASAIRAWSAPTPVKFFALGYGMVLLEEVFSALVNHASEGFSLAGVIPRIGQFWALNAIAFTALIVTTWVLGSRIRYRPGELFVLVGLTGLVSERTIFLLPGDPLGFLIFAPVMFAFYGLIMSPSILSLDPLPERRMHPIARWALFGISWAALAIVVNFALSWLRIAVPDAFPPCEFIPCA